MTPSLAVSPSRAWSRSPCGTVDAIHLGIVMTVNMETGMITPPVGLNLYVASGISNMGLTDVTKACAPRIVVMLGFLMPAVRIIFHEGGLYSVFYLLSKARVALELGEPGHVLRVQTLLAGDELGWSAVLPSQLQATTGLWCGRQAASAGRGVRAVARDPGAVARHVLDGGQTRRRLIR